MLVPAQARDGVAGLPDQASEWTPEHARLAPDLASDHCFCRYSAAFRQTALINNSNADHRHMIAAHQSLKQAKKHQSSGV